MRPEALEERVVDARDRYLRENGLGASEYTAPRFTVRVGGRILSLPNPMQRRRAVPRHDLHHVATGLGTDWGGEVEISAWETGAGLGGLWVAWLICVPLFLAGLLTSPRRTALAYRAGLRCRSLFVDALPYDEILSLTVGELRRRIGLPPEGLPQMRP